MAASAEFEVTLNGYTKVYTVSNIYVPYGSQIDVKMYALPNIQDYTYRLTEPGGNILSRMQSVNLVKNPEPDTIDTYNFRSFTLPNEPYYYKDVILNGVSVLLLTLTTDSTTINDNDTVTLATGTVVTATATGGGGAAPYSYSYSWVDPTGLSHPDSNEIVVGQLGLYSVTVTDSELQTVTQRFAVIEECAEAVGISVVKFVIDDQPVCCNSTYVKTCSVVTRACNEPPNPQIPSCMVNIAGHITSNEYDEFFYTLKVNNVTIGTGVVELLDTTEATTNVHQHDLRPGTSTITIDFYVIEDDDEEKIIKSVKAYIRRDIKRIQNKLRHICTDPAHKTGCPNCIDTLYYHK